MDLGSREALRMRRTSVMDLFMACLCGLGGYLLDSLTGNR